MELAIAMEMIDSWFKLYQKASKLLGKLDMPSFVQIKYTTLGQCLPIKNWGRKGIISKKPLWW